jgi:glycosyltransferase involved in cell wall biosynthesis
VTASDSVALVHDYLTQRGGAERVVLSLATAFPEAPIYTSLYDPAGTFPEFSGLDIRTLPINRLGVLRGHHRLALPVLAPAFSRLRVDADVVICSSSGWSHGTKVSGRKIVYCHTPARWLYQSERYLDDSSRGPAAALSLLAPSLRRWDRKAATTADRYLVNSHAVRARVADLYGIDAHVVHPPVDLDRAGPAEPVRGIEPGFFLCVSRLLLYKNVEQVVAAFRLLPDQRLVVVGTGPLSDQIIASSGPNVTVLGHVSDAGLRWLYASSIGLVAASYEDFGLTPVEAATFGKPTAALRWGGFLDTTVEGRTGVFFDEPEPRLIAEAVSRLSGAEWSPGALEDHARRFSGERFAERMREVVAEQDGRPEEG